MNTFAVVFICIQACLVQSVFTQCASRAAISDTAFGGYGFAAPALAAPYGFAAPSLVAPFGLTGPTLAAPVGIAAPGLAYDGLAYGASYGAGLVPYGGIGEGNVAVAGELPVAGTTAIAGQVPIMGAVGFSGPVAAAGTVSIAGQCACGYGAPYNYII